MAMAVVDFLEAVDVNGDEGGVGAVLFLDIIKRRNQTVLKRSAVEEAGQIVIFGKISDAVFDDFLLAQPPAIEPDRDSRGQRGATPKTASEDQRTADSKSAFFAV